MPSREVLMTKEKRALRNSEKSTRARTGCNTCRARKVKCDETKPACKRCLKFWGHCEGYARASSESQATSPSFKSSSRSGSGSVVELILLRRGLRPLFSNQLFKDAEEHRCFTAFQEETVNHLNGLFESVLWDCIILQACHDEPFVRDAAIAIGALSRCERNVSYSADSDPAGLTQTRYYRYALRKYGRALNQMRSNISYEQKHLRRALIGCLLIICFEELQGNYMVALAQALSGLKMLQSFMQTQQQKALSRGSSGNSLLETEIIQAFVSLDLQIMNYADPRTQDVHEVLKRDGDEIVEGMPSDFESVSQARTYWVLIQSRCTHFIATAAQKYAAISTPVTSPDEEHFLFEPSPAEFRARYIHKEVLNPEKLDLERRQFIEEIQAWRSAFESLHVSLDEEVNNKPWAAASLLAVHSQTTLIELETSCTYTQVAYDTYLPSYKSMLEILERICKHPHFWARKSNTFDIGIINPLRMIAKWCRDHATRRKAIKLLRDCCAVREGFLDALFLADIAEWLMEMEEEGMEPETGFIPERERAAVFNIDIDRSGRKGVVTASRLGYCDERMKTLVW